MPSLWSGSPAAVAATKPITSPTQVPGAMPTSPLLSASAAAPAMPAPTTWQAGQYQNAIDAWNAQGPSVYGAESSALVGQGAATAASQSALARLTAFSPDALNAFNPSDLSGYDPSKLLTGPSGSASRLAATYAAGGGGGGGQVGGAGPSGAGAFTDASAAAKAIGDFDPTAYGTTFAQGAESEFNQNLSTQLSQLERNAAGTGRLETGFYTGDQGTVATNLGKDFNSKIAEAATTFSGQRLAALTGSASALTGVDTAAASARQAGINEADYARLTQQGQALGAATAEEQLSVGEQEQAASLGLTRASDLSNLKYTQARDTSSMGLDVTKTGLEAALQEEQMARSSYSSAAATAGAYTSATRDWAAQDKATQDQIDYETALAKFLAGMGGKPTGPGGPNLPQANAGGAGADQTDPYAWYRKYAASLGVPFSGG